MPKVIDNYIHKDVAREIYDSIVERFGLSNYKSVCCYDSLIDRTGAFDYASEADFLFAQYSDVCREKHHFFINSFQHGSRSLGLHTTEASLDQSWSRHLTLLLGNGDYKGGDYYFLEGEKALMGILPLKEDFTKVNFAHNRFISSDPSNKRILSFMEESSAPALHLNLLLA